MLVEIIFSNAVLPEPKSPFRYFVKCDVGNVSGDRLKLNPDSSEIGDHTLTVTLKNAEGKKLDEVSSIIRIVPKNAGGQEGHIPVNHGRQSHQRLGLPE